MASAYGLVPNGTYYNVNYRTYERTALFITPYVHCNLISSNIVKLGHFVTLVKLTAVRVRSLCDRSVINYAAPS